ncbi:MAG: alkaline phosphatase, partial [Flavobacterium sp.]
MFNNYTKKGFLLLMTVLGSQFAEAQELLHYWHFNTLPSGTITAAVASDFSITGSGSITYNGTGAGYLDRVSPGDILNAQTPEGAGFGLRPRNPSNTRDMLIAFPTTGHDEIVMKFATTKTNQGATTQNYSYSLDGGATFTNAGLPVASYNPVTDVYNLVTLDFSNITGASNNPNFVVKISFGGATAAGDSGNNRFDNITVSSGQDEEPVASSIAFQSNFVVVNENAGTLSLVLTLVNPTEGSVNLVVKGAPFSTADANDFTLATQPLVFTAASGTTHTITIPIIDDTLEEQHAEYFVLSLENPVGMTIEGEPMATIYIKDNDRMAPVPTQEIQLDYVMSFDPSGTSSSTCEIVVHDPATQRLFTTSAVAGFLDIIDFSDPSQPAIVSSIDMNSYGGVTSVAVKDGVVAVASPNANQHLNGSVVFFDTDGEFLSQVAVGALPDNISFTPDGTKVLTANEG